MLTVLWKYGFAGLAFVALLLGFALHLERRTTSRLKAKVASQSELIDRLAREGRERIGQSERVITRVITVDRDATDGRARRVEGAPVAPNCKTPDAVLGADL